MDAQHRAGEITAAQLEARRRVLIDYVADASVFNWARTPVIVQGILSDIWSYRHRVYGILAGKLICFTDLSRWTRPPATKTKSTWETGW